MVTYNDLYLRANLQDNGSIPASGNMYTSPDIIPWGTQAVSDPASQFANYAIDPSQSLLWGNQNYIYTRATNLASGAETGQLYLYWSKASLITYPFLWSTQSLSTATGDSSLAYSAATANQQVVGAQPFVWTPTVVVGSDDHVCLVSQMVTAANPNPIPSASNISSFASFIANNRGFAWKNISIQNLPSVPAGTVPDWTATVQYDQGTTAAQVYVVLVCNNLPLGSYVSFTCGATGPTPPISLNQTQVTQTNQVIGVLCNIPANFTAPITYNLWLSGSQPSIANQPSSLSLQAQYVPPPDEVSILRAVPFSHGRYRNYALHDSIGPQPVVEVGNFSITNT